MKIDFSKPNAKAVSRMDAFFQSGRHEYKADQIGSSYYRGSEGWEKESKENMTAAFYEFMALKTNTNTSDEEIEKY